MILVIGATGYIGRYFCVLMQEEGIDVLALGRSEQPLRFLQEHDVRTQYFDFADDASFRNLPSSNIDGIIDLSACLAEHETPVQRFFDVNTIGAYRTLEFARQNDIDKVVITSSHKVYNDLDKQICISEKDGISFTGDHSPYIISKLAAENFVEYYNKDFGMNAMALRLTGVHGYGEVLGHLCNDGSYTKSTFEIFFEKVLVGDPVEVWGDQSIKRDHVYIKDVVNALRASVEADSARGIFNIASGVGYSQLEELNALINVFSGDKRSEITLRPELPGLTRGYSYDISKAERELGWKPKYTNLDDLYSDYKMEWERKLFRNYHHFAEGQQPATL